MRVRIVFLGVFLLGLIVGVTVILSKTTPPPPVPAAEGPSIGHRPHPEPPEAGSPEAAPEGSPAVTAKKPVGAPKPAVKAELKGAFVTGTVRNTAGAPIAGARVRVIEIRAVRRSSNPPEITTHTDASGRFEVSGIETGKHPNRSVYVVAEATGFFRDHTTVKLGGHVEFVLGPPGGPKPVSRCGRTDVRNGRTTGRCPGRTGGFA